MFSCKYCEALKNTYFEKHLRTAASAHFKIKRLIQHPAVKYLKCFCKKVLARCLTVQNISLEKKLLKGWTNFFRSPRLFSGEQFYFRARSGTQQMGRQNQSNRPIETQLETFLFLLCCLNRTCSFQFNSASIASFCNEAFAVLVLF